MKKIVYALLFVLCFFGLAACVGGGDTEIPVTEITISGPTEVEVGKQITLSAAIKPIDATSKLVTWSSSDNTKATITTSGVVEGLAEGEVIFTAKIGTISANHTVTVKVAEEVDPDPDPQPDIDKKLVVHYQNWTSNYDEIGAYTWNTGNVDWYQKTTTDAFGGVVEIELGDNPGDSVGVIVMDGGWSDEKFASQTAQWENAKKGTSDVLVDVTEFKTNDQEEMHIYVFFGGTTYFETKEDKVSILVAYYDPSEGYEENLGLHAWGGWDFIYDEEEVAPFGTWATPSCIFKTAAKSSSEKTMKVGMLQVSPDKITGSGFLIYAGDDATKKTPNNASDSITDLTSLKAGDVKVLYVSEKVAYYGETALEDFVKAAFTFEFEEMYVDSKTGERKGTFAANPTTISATMSLSVPITKLVDEKKVKLTEQELLESNRFKLFMVEDDSRTEVEFKEVSFSNTNESASKFVFTLADENKLDATKKYILVYQENEEADEISIELNMDTQAPKLEFKDQPAEGDMTITVAKGAETIIIPDYVCDDDRDGEDLIRKVYVSKENDNTVNTATVGTYTVKLFVEDNWGNQSELVLKVKVEGEAAGGLEIDLSDVKKQTTTIKVWLDDSDGEFITAVLKEFNKDYPHIIVEFTHYGTVDSREALKTSGASGLGADVFQFPHDHMAQALLEDLVYPLPDEVMNRLSPRLTDVAMDIATTNYNEETGKFEGDDEKMFAVPISIESIYLYYNKALIDEEDVPDTWEEIIEKAPKWEEEHPGKRYFMTSSHWADAYFSQSIFSAFGFRPFGPKGNDGSSVGFATGEVANTKLQAALSFMVNDLRPIVTGNGSSNSVLASEFEDGKAAIVIGGPWLTQTYREAELEVGAKLMPTFDKSLPSTKTATNVNATFAGAQMVAVYKYSNHTEDATTFVEYLASEKAAKLLYEIGGDCPALKTDILEKMEGIKDDPVIKVMLEQLETSIPMPTIPEVTYYWGPAESLVKNDLWQTNPTAEKIAEALVNAEKSFSINKALAGK